MDIDLGLWMIRSGQICSNENSSYFQKPIFCNHQGVIFEKYKNTSVRCMCWLSDSVNSVMSTLMHHASSVRLFSNLWYPCCFDIKADTFVLCFYLSCCCDAIVVVLGFFFFVFLQCHILRLASMWYYEFAFFFSHALELYFFIMFYYVYLYLKWMQILKIDNARKPCSPWSAMYVIEEIKS